MFVSLRSLSVTAATIAFVLVAGISTVLAITHATSLKFPIVGYFEECNDDRSTTNCQLATSGNSAFLAQLGDWRFDQGTVEIDNAGKVSLRVDDITPDTGSCPNGVAGLVCRCNGNGGYCSTTADCSGTQTCKLKDGISLIVEVWAQNYVEKHPFFPSPCNTNDCIRRAFSTGDCHNTFTFTTSGGGVNTGTANGAWHCDGYLSTVPGEIRDVEVRIGAVNVAAGGGNGAYTIPEQVLGVMSYSQQ